MGCSTSQRPDGRLAHPINVLTMCILCDNSTLDRLTVPLDRLAAGELADAIRIARDAAGAGIMEEAEAVLQGVSEGVIDGELFDEIVITRAKEAGVLNDSDAYKWSDTLTRGTTSDPRVLAFLAASAEILDDYRVLAEERRRVIEMFTECRDGGVTFSWLGRDGELWFEYRGDMYAALQEMEALEIVDRELAGTLHTIAADTLLQYTSLPDTGIEVINEILAKPAEQADSLLAGIIDLPALSDDRVRTSGFAPYFQDDQTGPVEDLRFGAWIIIRICAE